ncbi:MAG: 4Fe-4S dicluster domain-containing protein [Rhodocyclaceae bacterium]|nr:4Fe-4S dicluster domain-containing protein [Rhodocyclaceae bacterium]
MKSAPKGAVVSASLPKGEKKREKAEERLITVYIMGKAYQVPAESTIMGAIEYAGHMIVRGAGCREGYCGACATIYRLPGDYKIRTGLACMTLVEEGMTLAQIPSVPAEKAIYDIEKLKPNVSAIQETYPVVFRCVACGTCTKSCPQGLQVMDYVQAAKRGDITAIMDLSFDCVSCGLCMLRCPAEITQPLVGILGRRLYGRYLRKESAGLAERVLAVNAGAFEAEYAEMMSMSREDLSKLYYARDSE